MLAAARQIHHESEDTVELFTRLNPVHEAGDNLVLGPRHIQVEESKIGALPSSRSKYDRTMAAATDGSSRPTLKPVGACLSRSPGGGRPDRVKKVRLFGVRVPRLAKNDSG